MNASRFISLRSARRFAATLAAAAAGALVPLASHAVKTTGGEYNTLYAGLGAKGYDVVAYFAEGKPAKGSDRHTLDYGGVTWQFASRENRDRFAAEPARYAPQYGGFCSWGMAQGKLFDVDPENGWTVTNGKLYLNFNADINRTFNRDVAGFVAKADRQFPALNR